MPKRRYSRSASVPRMAGVALFLALSLNGFSQIPDERTFVVALRSDSVPPVNQITAELLDHNHQTVAQAPLTSDGEFMFRGVAYGEYWLVVTDGRGNTLSQTPVSVTAGATTTELQLDLPRNERPPSGGVSVSDLQKPPAREAVRAAEAARKQSAAGRDDKAATLLEKAIGVSPDFGGAYTNLTASYIRLGRNDQAIATAKRAIDLAIRVTGKPNAADLSNLACAQIRERRFAEAVVNARRAVEMEPGSDKAHLLYGDALAGSGGDLREAAQHLEIAAKTLPSAQPILDAVRLQLARSSIIATRSTKP
ncbi:MAG: hypothetical protein ABSH56_04070 [Bryobacteraceae bacterium]